MKILLVGGSFEPGGPGRRSGYITKLQLALEALGANVHCSCFPRATKLLLVNVLHHGCIIMAEDARDLAAVEFLPRPAPERVTA